MYDYEKLISKANNCRICALNCSTEWSKNFWMATANKLEEMAANLPLKVRYVHKS